MTRTSIGARRRLFVVETPLDTPDGFGGQIRSYVPGPQVWGALELVAGDERVRAGRAEEAVTHRIRLRHRTGIPAAARLALGPRRFSLRSASDPDGRERDLVCLVEEIKP